MRPADLACPSCGAKPGEPCNVPLPGTDTTDWSHDTRILQAMFTDAPDPVCSTCRDKGKVEIPEPDGTGLYDQACPDCDTPYPVTGDPDAEDPFTDDGMVLTADTKSVENVSRAWAETFAHLTDPDKPQGGLSHD